MALTLDPVLSGVPASITVETTTAQLLAPTAAMLAKTDVVYIESTAPYRWYRSNGSTLIELGSGTPGTVSSITYTGGNITAAVLNGVPYTIVYDGSGNPQTITGGGVTRTINYNLDGTVSSVV